MKVEITKNGLMVVPETDFEKDWLGGKFSEAACSNIEAFLKYGATMDHMIGLKITPEPTKNSCVIS